MRSVAMVLLTVLGAGCATVEGGQYPNLLSTQQEVQLGQQMAAEVQKETRPLNDAQIQGYVQEIGQRLAAVSPRRDVPYQFVVVDAPDVMNAFALPGGFLYVYSGLLKACDNEAELASVMGHEIGHVAGHHHGEQMTRQYGLEMVSRLVLGQEPNQLAQIVSAGVGQGVIMRFSRQDESEADQLGMDMMFRAGYQPVAALTFMNKLRQIEAREGGGGPGLAIFASHPPTEARLATMEALLARYPESARSQTVTNRERYQQIVLSRLGR